MKIQQQVKRTYSLCSLDQNGINKFMATSTDNVDIEIVLDKLD